MDKFKTNWQLTETVKPEDFNRIEGNIKENDTNISNLRTYSDQTFLNKNGKAKDSDKLDGIDSANFVSGSNQTKTEDTSGGGFDKTHSGFQRHNGNGLSGSLAMNIAHPGYQDGKYARGLTFNYGGDGFGVSTYAFGTQGENLGYAKIYTDKDKPTPNEIGAVSKEGDNLNGSLVFKNDTGLQSKDSGNNNRDMIRLNKSNQLVIGYNGQATEPLVYKGNQAYEIYHKGNKPTTDEIGAKNKEFPDTREENKSPKWYFENYPRQEITEFKYGKSLGLFPADNYSYGTLTTYVPWNSNSGGYPVQIFRSQTSATYTRTTNNNDTWLAWRKIYDSENKPTPSEIGAVASGQKIIPNKVGASETWIGLNGENSTYISNVNGNSEKSYIRLNGNGIVETNKGEIYTKGNKPTTSEIGAVSKSGDDISGTLKFRSQGNEIEIFNSGSTPHARGVVYKNNSNAITGMVGSLLNGQNAEKMFIGNTSEPWSGVNSLTVDKNGCYYNNQKIYHKGNKPSLGELGAEGKSDSFSRRGEINNTTNWNSLIEPGCYKVQMGNWGAASTNAPLQGYSFGLLMVYRTAVSSEDRIHQVYVPHKTNEAHWHRMCNAGSWQGWYPVDVRDSADNRYFKKSEDISVANGKRVITANNYGVMGKLTDGNADYMMYMGADNRIKLGYNNRGIDINGPVSINGYGINDNGKGERRNCLAVIKSDSVMEVGQFIDFHATGTNDDFTIRAEAKTDHSLNFWGGYKITADGTPLQKEVQQTPLWSGAQYMGTGQSAWPSRHLVDCQNGWILVWSDYDRVPDNENDYNWCYSYIPKNSPAHGKGQNEFFQVSTNENGDMTVKGLYIYNNRIDGLNPIGDAQSSGKWHDVVLRYVLEY